MTDTNEVHLHSETPPLEEIQTPAAIAVEQVVEVPNKPVAFGKFVKPEMYDVFGDYDLAGVTPAEQAWMKPENLGAIIFNDDRRVRFAVDGVVLNATEHALVARSPFKLIEHAEEQSLKDKDIDDEVLATAARSQIHALENKGGAMEAHHAKLVGQRALVDELGREARKPGFAHKSEERMKELTSAAWLEFTTILDVVHLQRGWDDEQRGRAQAALIHYLTQGSQRTRIAHWQDMITLSRGYLGARINLFQSRIRTVGTLLDEKNSEYAKRFA